MSQANMKARIEDAARSRAAYTCVLGASAAGKTQAVVERVVALLADGAAPDDVVAFASTRSAADALSARLQAAGAVGVQATTPAAYFERMLDAPDVRAFTGRVPRLLADFEQRILMEDMKVCGLKPRRLREMLKFFYRVWTELGDRDEDFILEDDERLVHDAVKGHLRLRGAMLVQELSNVAYRFLSEAPDEMSAPWRARHVLVDDFQNLNRASQQAVLLLATETAFVCGNVGETVATPEPYPYPQGLDEFVDAHADAEVHVLDDPAFSPAQIVAAGNALASAGGMEGVAAAAPAGEALAAEGAILYVKWTLPNDEFMGVARYIKHRLADEEHPVHPHDLFVAVPNAMWARALSKVLVANGIKTDCLVSYSAVGGDPRDEAKCADMRALSLLNLIADDADATAWRTWCGLGDYLTRSNGWHHLEEYARARGVGIPVALAEASDLADEPFPGAFDLARRYREARSIVDAAQGKRGFSLLATLKSAPDAALPARFLSLLDPVLGDETAVELLARARGRFESSFADVDAVRIGLMNMPVGLSFDTVIVMGAVEGFYPAAELLGCDLDPEVCDERMLAERRCWLACMAKARRAYVLSTIQKDEANTAAALGMRARRIRKEGATAMAQLAPSRYIEECGGVVPGCESTL